jgi:hypothetical protein
MVKHQFKGTSTNSYNPCKQKWKWKDIEYKKRSENTISLKKWSVTRSYGYKAFECEFCTHSWKTSNQNIIIVKYSILIGQFWSMKLVHKKFMAMDPGIKILKLCSTIFVLILEIQLIRILYAIYQVFWLDDFGELN